MENSTLEQLTIKNSMCIAELTQVSKQTSSDVDKLVKKMDMQTAQKEQIKTMERVIEKHSLMFKKLDIVFTIVKYPKIAGVALFGTVVLLGGNTVHNIGALLGIG